MATIRRGVVALVLWTLLVPGTGLRAQPVPDLKNSTHLGVGYVTSMPDIFVGITALGLTPALLGGAGLYADVKFSHDSPGDDPYYRDDISVDDAEITYGDQLLREKSTWLTVNFAVVYSLSRDFALYAGGGYLREEHYREYYDDQLERGNLGFYWVLDEAASGTRVNVLGGGLFRASRFLLFQVGMESRPGVMVGVMLTLPL
ncbi:MAG: hypothetical protein JSW71_16890 [Gemmatimonadota bacterium]|nr:MAG: hypothetical protein JSW71_16890 [Gemmatimonadota bacterium]